MDSTEDYIEVLEKENIELQEELDRVEYKLQEAEDQIQLLEQQLDEDKKSELKDSLLQESIKMIEDIYRINKDHKDSPMLKALLLDRKYDMFLELRQEYLEL